jgi:hypothetical protein
MVPLSRITEKEVCMFSKRAKSAALALGVLVALVLPAAAQRTPLNTGVNSFTTQQDIEMGRALSRQAGNELILSDDATANGYVRTLGNELAARAPGYRFPYEFRIFVDPDIRSIALPGGIIYLSSGLVAAAQTEPHLAAVLAHQIGHVAARHGSQQVSAEYSRLHARQARATVNDAISRLRLTMESDSLVTRYNSQAEQQADVIATQILYDTRFDPRQIPTAFQNLDQRDNSSRDFAFNHPTQPNRTATIRRELQRLGPLPGSWRGDSAAFRSAQQSLRDETPFGLASRDDRIRDDRIRDESRVAAPSTRWTVYRGVEFEIRYPDNWIIDETSSSLILAPDGGIISGDLAYGMMINTFQPETRSQVFGRNDFSLPGQSTLSDTTISDATDQLIAELRRSNPNIRAGRKTLKRVDGFEAVDVELTNTSPLGGAEVDHLTAVLHSNGLLYYFLGVTRQSDNNVYSPVFDRMFASIRFY